MVLRGTPNEGVSVLKEGRDNVFSLFGISKLFFVLHEIY